MQNNDKKYRKVEERYHKRIIASDIMDWLKNVGRWVKDMDYSFLDISEEAANILNWLSPNECIGKTDFDIAKEQGLNICEDWFAKICRGSDLYILENPLEWLYKTATFIELLTSSTGVKHIWRTVKGIVPPKEGEGRYYWGQAEFLDRTIGYGKALEMIENDPNLIKINKNLYVHR